jgi:hypothetical protein
LASWHGVGAALGASRIDNMPGKLKKLIRERMAKTGERYVTALAHVRGRRVARNLMGGATQTGSVRARTAPDLIVTRYFGQQVTFAIVAVQGCCVLMLAPSPGAPVTEVRRPHWRLLLERGVQ